jgi:hypothetical protein
MSIENVVILGWEGGVMRRMGHHFSLPAKGKGVIRCVDLWRRAGKTDLQRRHALPLWRVGGVLRVELTEYSSVIRV